MDAAIVYDQQHQQQQLKATLFSPMTQSSSSSHDEAQAREQPSRRPIGDLTWSTTRRRGVSMARLHHQFGGTGATRCPRRKRKVAFKNMYTPDVVPPLKLESYDELVFNVGGLFHTTSFLHEPDDWGEEEEEEDPTIASVSSNEESYEAEPPLERSIPLMLAEFFYRSAVFLGYPHTETPWLPGFRQEKKFSSNDVKRWRRLAHFDWETEEKEFRQNHAPRPGRTESVESNGHTSVMSAIGTSFRLQPHGHHHNSVDSNESSRSQESQVVGKLKFATAVTKWIRKYQRHQNQEQHDSTETALEHESEAIHVEMDKQDKQHSPVSWLSPPPVSSSQDLRLLVDIINSCIYCGHFQFRKRDIVRLCNVKI